MARRRPLPEATLIQSIDAYMRHKGEMSYFENESALLDFCEQEPLMAGGSRRRRPVIG